MGKVFSVELSGKHNSYADVALPLTPYEMLDVLDKLRMTVEEVPDWEIFQHIDFPELRDWIGSGSIHELNALATRLSQLNNQERIAFDGLLEMDKDKGLKIIPMHRLLDLAYSTGQCHLLEDVHTVEQLGRFAAENGFVPEVDLMTDELFEMLDFKILGERFMRSEGGVIVGGGYVALDGDLEQDIWQRLDLPIKKPDYTVLLELVGPDLEQSATLALPASPGEMNTALNRIDAATWSEVACRCLDCIVPTLCEVITNAGNVAHANRAAEYLGHLSDKELPKYKALLGAMGVTELNEALELTQRLDEYLLLPEISDHEEVGHSYLQANVQKQVLNALVPHVNLYQYGCALQSDGTLALTDYGCVERKDGRQLMMAGEQGQYEAHGMEMTAT